MNVQCDYTYSDFVSPITLMNKPKTCELIKFKWKYSVNHIICPCDVYNFHVDFGLYSVRIVKTIDGSISDVDVSILIY